MEKGMLHTHILVVSLFLFFLVFKTILLLINKTDLLDKVRAKTKVLEMILGTLILVTGGYLVYATRNSQSYMIGKIIIVFIAIPLGIVGLKRNNKLLALLSSLAFIYVYGVAETKSLKFKQDRISGIETAETKTDDNSGIASDTAANIISNNIDAGLANAKAVYEQQCVRCHGQDGTLGAAGAKDLSASQLLDEQKYTVIAKGRGLMPGYKNLLSEQEINNMVRYINTFKK
ncbi:MAG: SirB2 family protein [Cytophagaceae bacterium]